MSKGTDLILKLAIPGYGEDEVNFMEQTILTVGPEFVGDWGTNRGSSARIMLELSRLHGFDPLIVTVDLPEELKSLDRDYAGADTAMNLMDANLSKVQIRQGDGCIETLRTYVQRGVGKEAIFFVDGDHRWWNVLRELILISHAAPEATILLHDTRADPGQAIDIFRFGNENTYHREVLNSQAGMTRLTPCQE